MTRDVPSKVGDLAKVPWWPVAVALSLFAIPALGLLLTGLERGRGDFDQRNFHLPAIQTFAEQLPTPDVRDYKSATTPGYHLMLAAVYRWVTTDVRVLRVISSVFTLALLVVMTRWLTRAAMRAGLGAGMGLILVLPVMCSAYVFVPGVWLQPDNPGWLGVWLILTWTLAGPGDQTGQGATTSARWKHVLVLGAVLAALVLVRQVHIWTAGLVWLSAWLMVEPEPDETLVGLFRKWPERASWAMAGVLATLPAAGIVAFFVYKWNGLLFPPMFLDQLGGGPNWATPAFCLSLIAVYCVFFIGWLWPVLVKASRKNARLLFLAALGGVIIAAMPETTYLHEPRATGLWNVVQLGERFHLTIAGRTSPIIMAGSALGSVFLTAWILGTRGRARWIMLAAFVGFVAANTASKLAWQRYLEPMFLMMIPIMALQVARVEDEIDFRVWGARWLKPLRIAGPVVLAVLLALVTAQLLNAGNRLIGG